MLSQLPRPYRMLAEYRREEQGACISDCITGAFSWHETPEVWDFWDAINNTTFHEIPAASIRELVEAGKLKPSAVLEYVQQMFAAMGVRPSEEQVWDIVNKVTDELQESVNLTPPAFEPVNSPAHYTHGSVEVFDMMLAIWGAEKVRVYCEINAFKYRMRAGYKADAVQDIEKAKWYEKKSKEI